MKNSIRFAMILFGLFLTTGVCGEVQLGLNGTVETVSEYKTSDSYIDTHFKKITYFIPGISIGKQIARFDLSIYFGLYKTKFGPYAHDYGRYKVYYYLNYSNLLFSAGADYYLSNKVNKGLFLGLNNCFVYSYNATLSDYYKTPIATEHTLVFNKYFLKLRLGYKFLLGKDFFMKSDFEYSTFPIARNKVLGEDIMYNSFGFNLSIIKSL